MMSMLKRWFADGPMRAVIRNASYMGSGKTMGALLDLLALACAGRAMAPEVFGALVVVVAYARGVSDLVKFQTWQFIIRFGTPAIASRRIGRFRDVTGFAFAVDLLSGGVAVVAGMLAVPWIGHAVGIRTHDLPLAYLYCTLIPLMASATPIGILRALDRFDLLSWQKTITPCLRALGAGISWAAGLGFPGFVVTWYVARLVGDGVIWLMAIRVLRGQGIRRALRPRLRGPARRIPGAWGFVWVTNLGHSIWAAWGPGASVLVGILLGPAAAGLFKIAVSFFDAAGKPSDLLEKSFFPEIMRLDPASTQPWRLGLRSSAMAAGLGVLLAAIVALVGQPLIGLAFGPAYLAAYPVLAVMTIGLVLSMASFPMEPLLFMANRQRAALAAHALASCVYAILLVVLAHAGGLMGAAVAFVAGRGVNALLPLVPTLSAYRKRHLLSSGATAHQARAHETG